MSGATLLRGGVIVTQNKKRQIIEGDLLIENEFIKAIGRDLPVTSGTRVVDVRGQFVIPGFVQIHTHLCQALFRGFADDLALLDWLKKRIWPFEANHDPASLRASAQIGLLEMQKMGTTSILDMATVRNTHELFAAVVESGMRYWGGKCLMDYKNYSGPLYEPYAESLRETEELIKTWHQKTPTFNYALCPRFALSCSEDMLRASADLQKRKNIVIHTHASENKDEVKLVRKRTGLGNIDYFAKLKILNSRTVVAHGIHMSDAELRKMVKAKTPLAHCPSSNLKLGSGIAHIEKYRKKGLVIGLGADGAACNNIMDPFMEMRLAALLQKPLAGPEAMPAEAAFDMATMGGARALSADKYIGSLEVGKYADVVTVDRSHPSVATVENPYSALVYSCSGRDVRHVFIHGRQVVDNQEHLLLDEAAVIANAKKQLKELLVRSGHA